jgi:hypothetical protein
VCVPVATALPQLLFDCQKRTREHRLSPSISVASRPLVASSRSPLFDSVVSLAQPLHRHHRLAEVVERVHPPQAWGPLLPDEPVSRSFDRADLQALAHFRNCYSTEQVPQPYFSPFLPQHPYEGAFSCFASMVVESHRSCMRTSEPNSVLNF